MWPSLRPFKMVTSKHDNGKATCRTPALSGLFRVTLLSPPPQKSQVKASRLEKVHKAPASHPATYGFRRKRWRNRLVLPLGAEDSGEINSADARGRITDYDRATKSHMIHPCEEQRLCCELTRA